MDKKYQIFISSTYKDLVEERKIVQDTILSMYHFPVGMELFSAADEDQWDVIKETIDSSDYYVLIVAHRYGSIIPSGADAGISYTEKEYRYAKSHGVPILAFLIDPSVSVHPENIEREHVKELDAFISDIKTGRIVEWWKSKDELSKLVMNSLYKQFAKSKRIGWVRDVYSAESALSEIVKLNQQIRDLSEENTKLKEELTACQKTIREPNLTAAIYVDANNDDLGCICCQDYAIQDKNSLIRGIKVLNSHSLEKVKNEYKYIQKSDFSEDILPYAKDCEIDKYNASLPSEEEMIKYASEVECYLQNTRSCVHVNIVIYNKGTSKACNVTAEIEFPEGVIVYDDEIEELKEPESLTTYKDPIQLAVNRKMNNSKFPNICAPKKILDFTGFNMKKYG